MFESASPALALERFRSYLLLLAQLHWDARLQGKADPADLVQQTMLEALTNQSQFQGSTDGELARWLRKILAHNLADLYHEFGRAKRNVALEQSLEAALDASSSRIDEMLAADQSSPSKQAANAEELKKLADSVAQLPSPQREAVMLHHLQGLTLAETAQALERSPQAAAGLIRRGLKRLRELMRVSE
jgi:RNA polymerase sigma-70 factor (ECF subfamily)